MNGVHAVKMFRCLAVFAVAVWLLADDANAIRKAPELAFTIPGQGQQLLSQYRGKVIAIEFILTTCPHCQAASRVMTKFQQEYGSRGLQVIDLAINVKDQGRSDNDADALVESFARTYQVGFPVGWIPREQMMSFMGFSLAERMVVPQLVLIDRKGYIHYQTPASNDENWSKLMSDTAIQQHIEELLSQGSSSSGHAAKTSRHVTQRKAPDSQ
jgi:thiol-disulfide isomerase/thioredoxin